MQLIIIFLQMHGLSYIQNKNEFDFLEFSKPSSGNLCNWTSQRLSLRRYDGIRTIKFCEWSSNLTIIIITVFNAELIAEQSASKSDSSKSVRTEISSLHSCIWRSCFEHTLWRSKIKYFFLWLVYPDSGYPYNKSEKGSRERGIEEKKDIYIRSYFTLSSIADTIMFHNRWILYSAVKIYEHVMDIDIRS